MKKCFLFLVIFILCIISGCAAGNLNKGASAKNTDYIENHFVFTGESENWTGEMTVVSTLQFYEKDGVLGCDTSEDSKLTFTYKGDINEQSSAKHISISYDAGPSGGSMEEEVNADNPIQKSYTWRDSSKNGALIQKDTVMTVTVTIDGKSESFEMKNQG